LIYGSGKKILEKLKMKKGGTSKRRRKDDDYIPTPSELDATESSAAEIESDEEVSMNDRGGVDEEIDIHSYTAPRRHWTTESYSRERSPYQYALDRDTPVLFFHTQVQLDAFFGHLVDKTVFKHKYIDFGYMFEQPVMTDLVPCFEAIGLRNFLEHRCDWNDTIIRQFYATAEINVLEGTLEWMTGRRKYDATFAEFAAANMLDYNSLASDDSINILDEAVLSENEQHLYYEHPRTGMRRVFGHITGLRHHPAVINKIARVTFMPKSGNKEMVRWKYWNIIHHVIHRQKFNVVTLMMDQMADKKANIEMNIYFAPYIMSLIKMKTRFSGACPSKHTPFRPFKNDHAFLERELTPFPDPGGDDVELGEPAGAGGDEDVDIDAQAMPPPPPPAYGQWVPPPGYFDPYFATMQQSLSQQMAAGFDAMRASHQSLHDDIAALDSRFDDLNVNDQYQQILDRQQGLEDRFSQFNTTFMGFTDHFYSMYPRPPPPPPQG
jgi:hypothetical protein